MCILLGDWSLWLSIASLAFSCLVLGFIIGKVKW